jgi:hypothetical protein
MQGDFSDFFSHIFLKCGKTKAPTLQGLHLEIINSLIRRFTIRNLALLHLLAPLIRHTFLHAMPLHGYLPGTRRNCKGGR